jgi:hypothetical protein
MENYLFYEPLRKLKAVLRFALAAYASSASGGTGVNPGQLR